VHSDIVVFKPASLPVFEWRPVLELAEEKDTSLAALGTAILALSDISIARVSVRKRFLHVLQRWEPTYGVTEPLALHAVHRKKDQRQQWIKLLLEVLEAPQQYASQVISEATDRLIDLVGPVDPAVQDEGELGLPLQTTIG
jgi:hypothetical protein